MVVNKKCPRTIISKQYSYNEEGVGEGSEKGRGAWGRYIGSCLTKKKTREEKKTEIYKIRRSFTPDFPCS